MPHRNQLEPAPSTPARLLRRSLLAAVVAGMLVSGTAAGHDRAAEVPAEDRAAAVAAPKPKPVPRAKQREARRAQAHVRTRVPSRMRARSASLFSAESYIWSTSRADCYRSGIDGLVNVRTWGSLGAVQGEYARWRPMLKVYTPARGFFWRTGTWTYFQRSYLNEGVLVGGAYASSMNRWMAAYHGEAVQGAIQVDYYQRGTYTTAFVPTRPGLDFTIGVTGNWCAF
jgi:hypothetical protein